MFHQSRFSLPSSSKVFPAAPFALEQGSAAAWVQAGGRQGGPWQSTALGGLRAEPPRGSPGASEEGAPPFRHEQGWRSREAALGSPGTQSGSIKTTEHSQTTSEALVTECMD